MVTYMLSNTPETKANSFEFFQEKKKTKAFHLEILIFNHAVW